MSEYWKSTPKYWCKFCETYVRDTGIERKNHEATAKHQGNIQRSLREVHKGQQRQQREQQRAKDEVARLNNLVGGKDAGSAALPPGSKPTSSSRAPAFAPPQLSADAQRKAHAEQLVSLGVALPENLKREVTGVGGWQTVSEQVVPSEGDRLRDLVDVKSEREGEEHKGSGVNKEGNKRRADDEDDELEEQQDSRKRKTWGSRIKEYPGTSGNDVGEDLDALISGIAKKKAAFKAQESNAGTEAMVATNGAARQTPDGPLLDSQDTVKTEPYTDEPDNADVKQEENESAITAPPVVIFKKRKSKK